MIKQYFIQNPVYAIGVVMLTFIFFPFLGFVLYFFLTNASQGIAIFGSIAIASMCGGLTLLLLSFLGNWTIVMDRSIMHSYWFRKTKYRTNVEQMGTE